MIPRCPESQSDIATARRQIGLPAFTERVQENISSVLCWLFALSWWFCEKANVLCFEEEGFELEV